MRHFLARLRRDRRGATTIEYGLIAGLIFLVILTGVNAFGAQTGAIYDNIKAKIGAAMG